jgi:hypothetical protein
VSNAPSCSNAASGAPSGKRLIVANGGGCDQRKSDNFFLFQSSTKQGREVEGDIRILGRLGQG